MLPSGTTLALDSSAEVQRSDDVDCALNPESHSGM